MIEILSREEFDSELMLTARRGGHPRLTLRCLGTIEALAEALNKAGIHRRGGRWFVRTVNGLKILDLDGFNICDDLEVLREKGWIK